MTNNMETNKIYNESCLDTLKQMPNDFLDCVITSPPYDNLRAYNNKIDETWGESIWKPIISSLYDKTKDGGVVVWVVGDAVINSSETGTSFRQALYAIEVGFKLWDTMIYQKTPSFPASVNDKRYSQNFEYMFILSKGIPKTANLLKDRKNKWGGSTSWGKTSERLKDGTIKQRETIHVQDYGYRFNIWEYATGKGNSSSDEIAFEHPAIFPEKLVGDHIMTWTNENDLVFDPFMGSGTTAKMCCIYNRQFIGSDLNEEYVKLANKRIDPYLKQTKLF
jgi:site-specific DNA-methyltransferase (adenine-specific)